MGLTGFWPVELADGTLVSVEPSLTTISSYVLLEQEDWFEKEIAFVRRMLQPGMTIIDVGANIGIYSLVMARAVGPSGAVLAVEPLDAPRRHIERGINLNRLTNVTVIAAAVADTSGVGHMRLDLDTEMASLSAETDTFGKRVEVTTLDRLAAALAAPPDFIKIDAEGAERLVIAGGAECLRLNSPLLMLEIRNGGVVNSALLADLVQLGFGLYTALPDGQGLVPHTISAQLDEYELNVFACKADRACALAERGLLTNVRERPFHADLPSIGEALTAIGRSPFAGGFPELFEIMPPLADDYGAVLAAWSCWQSTSRPLANRYSSLKDAYNRLAEILPSAPSPARLATMMRISAAVGQRSVTVRAAGVLFEYAGQESLRLDEPFLPPHPRYDAIPPAADIRQWLLAAAGEQYEQSRVFSSAYSPMWPGVRAICRSGYVSTEMFRRLALRGTFEKLEATFDDRLLRPATDHRNAQLWRNLLAEQIIARSD